MLVTITGRKKGEWRVKKKAVLPLVLVLALVLVGCGRSADRAPASAAREATTAAAPSENKPALKAANDNTGVVTQGSVLGSKHCDDEPGTVYSEIWEVPDTGSVTRRFYNYTDGLGMWNNFLVYLQNTPEGHSEEDVRGYRCYAVLRPDHFLSGDDLEDVVLESDWDWDRFTKDMNGALIELTLARKDEQADVSFTATARDGSIHQQSYQGIPVDGPLYFCLSVDHAFLDLLPDGEAEAVTG